MLARIDSCAVQGIDALVVRTEVDVGRGETRIFLVGLPDKAVQESIQRVAPAIRNSNFSFPHGRTTINLAPADNVAEATVVEGLAVYPVRTLWEAAEVAAYPERRQPAPSTAGQWELADPPYPTDFADVKGPVTLGNAS